MSQPESVVAAARLRGLDPIDKLTQSSYRDLLAQTAFRKVAPGGRVFVEGEDDDWSVFLIEGAMELHRGTDRQTVRSGTNETQGALGSERPCGSTARAVSECTIAKVPTSLLDMLAREARGAGPVIEVDELAEEQDSVEDQLMLQLYEAYASDTMDVPSLPDVALHIRRAVEDPHVDSKDIERIVTADPVVAARLMQVANSAAYMGVARIETCRDAVTKLGFSATREVVTSIVLKQLFSTESPVLKRAMDDIWHHSTAVAAISFHLAKELSGFSPDRALLAGLVHDIGALPLIGAAQTYGHGDMSAQALKRCIDSLRGQLGAMVLRRWEFPDDLVTVALEAEDWYRDDEPTADYCDLVMVAQIFSVFGKPEFSKFPQVSTLPAFARLTKGELDVDDAIAVLNDAQSDIEDLQKVLCA